MRTAGILLCAGSSARMGQDKLSMSFGGKTPIQLSFEALVQAGVDEVIFAVSESSRAAVQQLCDSVECPTRLVLGGDTRQQSVLHALREVSADIAAIHDAARCLVTPQIIKDCLLSVVRFGSGVAAIPLRDTLRREGDPAPIPRDRLWQMQTPQCFYTKDILSAYLAAETENFHATDDCSLFERYNGAARFVEASVINQKLTSPNDRQFFERVLSPVRIGYGEDTHRLIPDRKLILGGVEIPFELGLLGHSDADVLTHAIIDALLGAAAMRDIGFHFPDTAAQYEGVCSLTLLKKTCEVLESDGYSISNIDSVILAQRPRLCEHIPKMAATLADTLRLPLSAVSVKATTPEGLGPEGRLESISAKCVALIKKG